MNESFNQKILMAHGAGGRLTHELVEKLILRKLNNPALAALDDAADIPMPPDRLAFTMQGYPRPIPFRAARAAARSSRARTRNRGVGIPSARKRRLHQTLSIARALSATPEPVYGIPATSRNPWIVPSSP